MHGRPRQPIGVPEDPKKAEARHKKYQQLRQLTELVLRNVKEENYSHEALEHSALLLSKNPDMYTLWGFRRDALSEILKGKEGMDKAKEAAEQELTVSETALIENHKSYSAWYHRLWIMRLGLLPLDKELQQINKFLAFDSRNFHAWKYRREINKLAGTDIEDELAYARRLIDQDFSNYSAWHARSALLTEKYSSPGVVTLEDLMAGVAAGDSQISIPLAILDEEFDLTKQAFFTDPADQSAYFYHRWLLKSLMEHASRPEHESAPSKASQEVLRRLEEEQKSCRELLKAERNRLLCKWPLQSLAFILRQKRTLGDENVQDEMQNIYQELIHIDPYRAGFYKDAAASCFHAAQK